MRVTNKDEAQGKAADFPPPPPAPPLPFGGFTFGLRQQQQQQQPAIEQQGGVQQQLPSTAVAAAAAASASISASAAAASSFFSTLTSSLAAGNFPRAGAVNNAQRSNTTGAAETTARLSSSLLSDGSAASFSGIFSKKTDTSENCSRNEAAAAAGGGEAGARAGPLKSSSMRTAAPASLHSEAAAAAAHELDETGEACNDAGSPYDQQQQEQQIRRRMQVLQKQLRHRERELRAALHQLRQQEETVRQEQQLLGDVLQQNGFLEPLHVSAAAADAPRTAAAERQQQPEGSDEVGPASQAEKECVSHGAGHHLLQGLAAFKQAVSAPASKDVGSTTSAAGASSGAETSNANHGSTHSKHIDVLVGVQQLANLIRLLQDENHVLLLFAQMIFPTYAPLFARSNSSSRQQQHQRLPPLNFEELRTKWLETEEARGVAAAEAQHAAVAHARHVEQQNQQQQQQLQEKAAAIAALQQQLAKVTKEKALLLLSHMHQRSNKNSHSQDFPSSGNLSSAFDAPSSFSCTPLTNEAASTLAPAVGISSASVTEEKRREFTCPQCAAVVRLPVAGAAAGVEEGEKRGDAAAANEVLNSVETTSSSSSGCDAEAAVVPLFSLEDVTETAAAQLHDFQQSTARSPADGRCPDTKNSSSRDASEEVAPALTAAQRGDASATENSAANAAAIVRADEHLCDAASAATDCGESSTQTAAGIAQGAALPETAKKAASAADAANDSAAEVAALARVVEELKQERKQLRSDLQRHKDQARSLLSQRDEALQRVQQKLLVLQQQREKPRLKPSLQHEQVQEYSSNSNAMLAEAARSGEEAASTAGAAAVNEIYSLQELALQKTRAFAEVRQLREELDQVREKMQQRQQEICGLRLQLQRHRQQWRSESDSQQGSLLQEAKAAGTVVSDENQNSNLAGEETRQTGRRLSLFKEQQQERQGPGENSTRNFDGVIHDSEYLKHVLIRYIQYSRGGDDKAAASLLPVLATVLRMNETERQEMLTSSNSNNSSSLVGRYVAAFSRALN